jgi:halogenation protein CepH
LVGDAACFIDPVFSSGVHLATYSALLAARAINTRLRGELDDERCFAEFETRYRREFGNFYQFLMAFYDMNQDADSYFWSARKIVSTEERDNEAFIRLVAGRSQVDEPAFYEGSEFFDAREGFGLWMEQTLNPAASTNSSSKSRRSRKAPRRVAGGFDATDFMAGFTQEIAQLQVQARLGGRRGDETPLERGGLIPSRDGLEWIDAEPRSTVD